ncbi:MAG: right-handed parallel beta-helix repeat-containing protein [Chloroflexota bacterium]
MARTHRTLTIGTLMLAALLCALATAGPARAGASVAYADPGGDCANLVPCFTSIQGAVNNVGGPEAVEVRVFPGTYNESIDLTTMGSETPDGMLGDITLIGVGTANETPSLTPPTIHGEKPISAEDFGQNVTIDGFVINQEGGDGGNDGIFISTTGAASITVRNVTSSDADDDGIEVKAQDSGNVTLSHLTTNNNGHRGIYAEGFTVTVTSVTANGNLLPGFGDGLTIHAGSAMISDVEAESNGDDGLDVEAEGGITIDDVGLTSNTHGGAVLTGDPITITNSTGSANGGTGFELVGPSTIAMTQASGNGGDGFTQSNGRFDGSNFVAESNTGNGIHISSEFQSDIAQGTFSQNGLNGIFAEGKVGGTIPALSVIDSVVKDNTNNGILLDRANPGGPFGIHQNIICGNDNGGLDINSPNAVIDAEGNWWGSVTGPTHETNPGGTGDKIFDGAPARGTVDFVQWISQIEATEVAQPAAAVGVENALVFVFTTEDRAWQIHDGPGSTLKLGPFVVGTDNGTIRIGDQTGTQLAGRISNSQLRVGVIADHAGDATITLTEPCGGEFPKTITVRSGPLKGDLDCEGSIDVPDALRSLRAATGLPLGDIGGCPFSDSTLDINCNAQVEGDGQDPLLILLHIADTTPVIQLPDGCEPIPL